MARAQRTGLQLRTIARHIEGLTVEHTRHNNRLQAEEKSQATPRCVAREVKRSLASLASPEKRIVGMRREVGEWMRRHAGLCRQFDLLLAIPGIVRSARCSCSASSRPCPRS